MHHPKNQGEADPDERVDCPEEHAVDDGLRKVQEVQQIHTAAIRGLLTEQNSR